MGPPDDERPRVRRLASREVYRNAWMRVTEDTMTLPGRLTGDVRRRAQGRRRATAATELREETGLVADQLEVLGVLHEAYGYATQRAHVVLATGLTAGAPEPEQTEVGLTHRWVTRDEFWRLQQQGIVTDAVSVAAIALFERRLAKASAG